MSNSIPESHPNGMPTADDLAGTPACREEDAPTIRVRTRSDTRTPKPAQSPPTADELAGIPIAAEGKEDLTVRNRQRFPRR